MDKTNLEEEIDEKAHVDFTNSYIKHYKKFRKNHMLKHAVDKAKHSALVDVSNKHGMEQANLLKDKYMKEEITQILQEPLEEISKETLGSYIKKASEDASSKTFKHGMNYGRELATKKKYDREGSKKLADSYTKRRKYIDKATDRLVKEDEQLVESDMSHEAVELHLHGDNTSHLYHSSQVPVMKNLEKKFKKGIYDHEKAKILWGYHADRVAQDYHKEYGSKDQPWHKMFSTKHRKEAAAKWADEHRDEMSMGNFNESVDIENYKMIEAAINDKPSDFENNFVQSITQRILYNLEDVKNDIASTMFEDHSEPVNDLDEDFQEERLDEVSADTLISYVGKASKDNYLRKLAANVLHNPKEKTGPKSLSIANNTKNDPKFRDNARGGARILRNKISQRKNFISKAVNKLSESEQE